MDKLEKVIKGLEEVQHFIKIEDLPAHTLKAKLIIDDALTLLKAQEQKPISASIVDSDGGLMHWWACGNCQAPINPEDKFCHECGKAVKWDG